MITALAWACLTLPTWAAPEHKAVASLLRGLEAADGPRLVLMVPKPGHSCRPMLDALGPWAARLGPVHLVSADQPASLENFLSGDAAAWRTFARLRERRYLLIESTPAPAATEALTRRAAELVRTGLDRRGWRATSVDHMVVVIETQPLVSLVGRRVVRDAVSLASHTATLDGCAAHVFTPDALTTLLNDDCAHRLTATPQHQPWARPD